jgi:cytochrome c-type biogenesis protein CcmH
VIAFIVACVVMAAVAIAFVVRPLVKPSAESEAKPANWAAIATAVALPLLAAFVYSKVTTQPWGEQPPAGATANPEIEGMVNQLAERLKREPNDVEGWVMLGRSLVMLGRYPLAVDAYSQAYDLTRGENVSALTGLAEALVLTDEASLSGRAGELIESALVKSPREPRALWYGSLAALSAGKLDVARERMQALLDQNPPDSVRSVLEAQIADITRQLGADPATAQAAPASTVAVKVAVSLAPAIAAQVKSPLTLFVLARTVGGGAPLAVVRLTSDQLPMTVDLSDANAMIAGRGLSSVPRVQIVARLSMSGSPQAQPGDFYGEADYVVQPGTGSVTIVIDRVAP